jgi:hypothetical protein
MVGRINRFGNYLTNPDPDAGAMRTALNLSYKDSPCRFAFLTSPDL